MPAVAHRGCYPSTVFSPHCNKDAFGAAAILYLLWEAIAAAAERIAPNYLSTLTRKARVFKIRALRALDFMGAATRRSAPADWATTRVAALPELWGIIAKHSGVVGAWRLTGVCRASREGAKAWLRTLPGLVVCGGWSQGGRVSDVWRLDLATLRWEPMPALVTARQNPVCCAVRGTLVVLGGQTSGEDSSEVEMLSSGAFMDLPPLSRGGINGATAIEVDESDSTAGQVLLLGGEREVLADDEEDEDEYEVFALSTVYLVDLATGACARQPDLLHSHACHAAARLPDGRIICAGGEDANYQTSAEVWGPPGQGATDAAWAWGELPAMSVERYGCCGCVLSDGRFAVLGGQGLDGSLSSCEALVIGDAAHWEPLPPMHDSRRFFACAAVAGCVIVAGGPGRTSAEVYDESRNRWLRLPCNLPYETQLFSMSSALLSANPGTHS
jgi:hypothetical protein